MIFEDSNYLRVCYISFSFWQTSFGLTKDVQSLPFMGENRRKRKGKTDILYTYTFGH